MHDAAGLFGNGGDQLGVVVAERGDRDAGAEVEVAAVRRVEQVRAFAMREGKVGAGVVRH